MIEEELFHRALEKPTLAEQLAFLDEVCANQPEIRERVERLLRSHRHEDSFLRAPVATVDEPITKRPGTVIGPYKLLEQIGEGGFGVVFLAEQTEPVRRKVALKVLKPGMDTRQVVARFEAERQALAIMDHPNIARVFDGGVVGQVANLPPGGEQVGNLLHSGRPYFVMELVQGVPITRYCDEHYLSLPQRLDLFLRACEAVQHAHQKGVIHRDLKPSNILVGNRDDKPVLKVIDFGVAKAMGQQLTEKTLFTGASQMIGTPLYMSPEQAGGNSHDVDTRSDIYSLGVVLYELLTGTTPIDKERLQKAGFDEMVRLIREEEPPKPSTRLSSTEELPSVAAQRHTEPAKLTKLVRGELDWIVMKALEKDRNRRYETANGFAMDIQRYLADEPVLACPPSAIYRLKKFVRRNKGTVIAAGLLLLALLVGIAGTSYGLLRADQQRVRAEENEKQANAERQKAIEFRDKALDALRATTGTDVEKLIGEKKALGPNEKAYLEAIAQRWQVFARQEGTDEQSRAIQAEGHFRVALLWQKLGRRDEARVEYELALDLRKLLAEQFPSVPKYQEQLAGTHNNLGSLLVDFGHNDLARAEYEKARDRRRKLADQYPAEPAYQRELASTHHNLGLLLAALGQRDAARADYETARDLLKKLAEQYPAVPAYQHDLAGTQSDLVDLLAGQGQRDAARVEYEKLRDLRKKLVEQYPNVPEYQQDLARTHNNLGILLLVQGQRDAALAEYEKARDLRKKLTEQYPDVPLNQQQLARTHNNLGLLLRDMGRRVAARLEAEKARDLYKTLAEQFPAVPDYQIDLGGSYCNLGKADCDDGQLEASLTWFGKAIATLEPVHRAEPRDLNARQFLRKSFLGRATAYDALTRHAEAIKDWDRVIELSSPVEQGSMRAGRAISRLQAGQVVEAVAEVAELTKREGWPAEQWYDFAGVYSVASGKIAERKQEYADRAMDLLRRAVKAGYKDGAHMAKDADLDPLRDRDDFKMLLAELGAGKN